MSDYKQRMIREHRELQERISKLAHMLEGYAEGTLDFTPACSFQLLESQLYAMGAYANILQERARIEQVDLNAPLECVDRMHYRTKWHESYQAALMEMIETFEKGENA